MKIYTLDMLKSPLQGRYVATIGFFDGVHRGHRFLLDFLRGVGRERGLATLVVTFPDSPSRVLRPQSEVPLLTTADEKCRLLEQCGVDSVVLLPFTHELSSLTAFEFMEQVLRRRLGVDVLVMGYDHRFGRGGAASFADDVAYGRSLGLDVVQAPAYHFEAAAGDVVVSSSAIREVLLQGEVEKARIGLGYDFFLEGQVTGGYHVGTSLGYPTANISVPAFKLVPADGVYAVRVELDGWKGAGMLNIGHRPTLDNGTDRSVEVHIFDFHENIYSEHIRVSFVKFVRRETRFESLDALKQQLQTDEAVCRRILY